MNNYPPFYKNFWDFTPPFIKLTPLFIKCATGVMSVLNYINFLLKAKPPYGGRFLFMGKIISNPTATPRPQAERNKRGRIMSEYATFINRIKQEVDTADLADRLGLDFDRGRKVAHCFNTNAHANGDKHPSLGFYQRNGEYRYKCFTCGTSGTAIDLYAQVKGVVPLGQSPTGKELIQVCNELGEMYGIKPPQGERRTFKGKNTPKTIIIYGGKLDFDYCGIETIYFENKIMNTTNMDHLPNQILVKRS